MAKKTTKTTKKEAKTATTTPETKVAAEAKTQEVVKEDVKKTKTASKKKTAPKKETTAKKKAASKPAKPSKADAKQTKPAAKASNAKKTEAASSISHFFEIDGEQISTSDIEDKIREAYKADGHRIGNLKDVSVYYNFAERRAYYVVNGKAEDKFIEF